MSHGSTVSIQEISRQRRHRQSDKLRCRSRWLSLVLRPHFTGTLACYAPRPTQKTGATEADYLNMLPPLDQAQAQMELGYLLGSIHYTTLGDYGRNYFDDTPVENPLAQFNKRLDELKDIIKQRNKKRRPYKFLLPSGIPQSINI